MGGDFSGPATRSLEPRETVDPSFSYRAPEAPSADDDLDLREFIENIEKGYLFVGLGRFELPTFGPPDRSD